MTDPDAGSMSTSGRGTGIVGYNVQTAVDVMHHLIVAHEVTNVGHERDRLGNMDKLAEAATGKGELIALADRGRYEGYETLKCERSGVAAVDYPFPVKGRHLLSSPLARPSRSVYVRCERLVEGDQHERA